MNIRALLLFTLLCVTLTSLRAQHPVAAGVFDRTDIETGDTFVLRILVSGTEARPDKTDFSPWGRWIPVENVLRSGQWQRSGAQWINNYTLIAFDSFSTALPPLPVRLLSGDSAMTNPISLAVRATAAPDSPAEMDPIRDIQPEHFKWSDGLLLLLVAGAMAGGVVWWRRSRRLPLPVATLPIPDPVTPALSPTEVALQKLRTLALPQKEEDVKPFYAALSLILNEYIETRYSVPAMESTTRETARLLQNTDFPTALWKNMKQILEQADRVKYAGDSGGDHPKMVQLAIATVQADVRANAG